MPAQMPITLPYNLKHDELIISTEDVEGFVRHNSDWLMPDEESTTYMDAAMEWCSNELVWSDDDPTSATQERIFRAAVILFNRADNKEPFGKCLCQAIIWEVG